MPRTGDRFYAVPAAPVPPPEGGRPIEIRVPGERLAAWSGADLALLRVQLERLAAWGWTVVQHDGPPRGGVRLLLTPPREARGPGDPPEDPGPCPF